MDIRLQEILDEAGLRALLAVAVADATPQETMPPVDGPPGWTDAKQQSFLEFFRPAVLSKDVAIFTIMVDRVAAGQAIAGFMRLKRMPDHTAETGMWLGRSYRGKGIGAAAFEALLAEAAKRGYTRVIADTTPQNFAALGVLRRGKARMREADGKIFAEIAIDPGYAADLEK